MLSPSVPCRIAGPYRNIGIGGLSISAQKKKPTLRDLSRHELEDWDAHTKEAIGESDRAYALVVAALLDQALMEAIKTKLIRNEADD
jgi:hypothetical protein